jgi:hypothetical protein
MAVFVVAKLKSKPFENLMVALPSHASAVAAWPESIHLILA